MPQKTALILGATGVSGRSLLTHLTSKDDWKVIGASRRAPDFRTSAEHVAVDLSDPADAKRAFAGLKDVTHVFSTAYVSRPDWNWADHRLPNITILKNAIDAIEPVAKGLEHVCLLQGTKYYGQHLGPFKNPAREDDPRHMPPNFYFDQQDLLIERSEGKAWSWSCARPHVICGLALGNPLNLISVLGVYATISKELGVPLRFPGKPGAFETIYQATDAGLLARAMEWMAITPSCAGEAFNITNGDFFRYKHLWPKIADYFGIEAGPPQQIDLVTFMSDKTELWDRIVKKHGLQDNPYARVADWNFANYAFSNDWDVMSDTTKCRKHGFLEFIDTHQMFLDQFDQFRAAKIIP
ncbi:NAD-dependent dehydratase [Hoeflea sp. BAL378]|uniref:SDR family oxidoreductase n=1 Tax=Hoeflea sp. BAL378 TaxID=1547437 RepID=UPI000512CA04|nr:SDR family oxidoreductase [Hoeflea sp. BAL378]KGF69773.1 NAD-dependent dehydratase [Hoeflea sp. BAL378]